jgi:Bacterial virulence factor lipase N-terminal
MLLDVKLSRRLLFCVIGAAVCTSGIGESSHYLKDEPPRVHPLFQLSDRAASPFPSDIFTVVDAAQATGRRVNLPYPGCGARPSDCDDIDAINTLDGFGLNARISIPFDGAIDPTTVSDHNVFVISRSSTLRGGAPGGHVIGINQVVWDTATHTLHVEVNEMLDQYRQYVLIVTDGIHDELGRRIKPSTEFKRFHHDSPPDYRARLEDAVAAAETLLGIDEREIAVASAFTTQSITPVMERIRDAIKSDVPAPANFLLGPSGERTVHSRASIASMVHSHQNGVSPPNFVTSTFPLNQLDVVPGAIATIGQGSYQSPIYVERPSATIPTVGTLAGVPPVQSYGTTYFTVYLPSGPKPVGGWPVMLTSGAGYRHQGTPSFVAYFAARGVATVGLGADGFGFGPLSTLRFNFTDGTSLTIADPGRSYDQNGDNLIGAAEGSGAAGPRAWTTGASDTQKQTVIDLMQLTRVIELGMDVDGDGSADLDGSRISYHGQSAGGVYGAILAALDPSVKLLTVSGCCGLGPEHGRWNTTQRGNIGRNLSLRIPSLINEGGLTSIDGVAIAAPFFNENKPLRNQPIVVNTVPGAIEIQEALEMAEWGRQTGATAHTWMPYLRTRPLAGMSPKAVAVYVLKGDQSTVNPSATECLTDSGLLPDALYYRHDLAFAQDPTILKNPHMILFQSTSPNTLVRTIARGMQAQMAEFHASGGTVVNTPYPVELWEVPMVERPDSLNFIR